MSDDLEKKKEIIKLYFKFKKRLENSKTKATNVLKTIKEYREYEELENE